MPVVLHKHRLVNPITLEEFLLVSFFDKITANMASCLEIEEEMDEEGDRRESSKGEDDKTLATLEILPVSLN